MAETDEAPSSVKLEFPREAFGIEALKRAAYRFLDRFSVELTTEENQYVCLVTFREAKSSLEEKKLITQFRDELLDQDLRRTIAEETAAERNAILAYAFSKTGLQD